MRWPDLQSCGDIMNMCTTYSKTTSDAFVKAKCVSALVNALSGDLNRLHTELDKLYIRGGWEGFKYTGYDYDLQSWLTVEVG